MVTRPLDIMLSRTGRKVSIFCWVSTIYTMIGKSCDTRKILVVWMRSCVRNQYARVVA